MACVLLLAFPGLVQVVRALVQMQALLTRVGIGAAFCVGVLVQMLALAPVLECGFSFGPCDDFRSETRVKKSCLNTMIRMLWGLLRRHSSGAARVSV